jgi:soluble cytochrome b562
MSDTTPARGEDEISEINEYKEKQQDIESTIAWIDNKLENGRIRDPERARARQGYLRLKIKAIGEWRKLKEAGDLAELEQEVEELKETRQRVKA